MEGRRRYELIEVQPARNADVLEIQRLWEAEGERNVDVRSASAVEAAISSGGLHTFRTHGQLIATGGFYSYGGGVYTELGSSCWATAYRGLGGAEVSVCFRAILALLYEPGTVLASELYASSVKSARVLARCGAERLEGATFAMHEHGYQANPIDPVNHHIIPPWPLPMNAEKFLRSLDGAPNGPNGELVYQFSKEYNFDDPGIRKAIERLARGDLEVAGHVAGGIGSPGEWLAAHVGEPLLSFDEFLIRRELMGMSAPLMDGPKSGPRAKKPGH